MEALDKKSITKSLSDTVSREFLVGFLKPRAFVVLLRFIEKLVPASAPTPNGFSSSLLKESTNLN